MATAQQKSQLDEAKEKLLATLSTEELASPSCRVSERLGRKFSSRTEYENKEVLNAAIDEAQKVFPVATDAYKPSGNTTALAVFLMVLAAPLLLVLMTGISFGLCWGWEWLEMHVELFSKSSRLMGLGSIFLDLILVILMVAIPTMCYQATSKMSKNRNPLIPAVLTGLLI